MFNNNWCYRALFPAIFLFISQQPATCQTAPSMPSWLVSYPGAKAETSNLPGLIQSTYITAANVPAVVDHYGRLFEAQKLAFMPNPDGIGSVIRGTTPDCDLLIIIH